MELIEIHFEGEVYAFEVNTQEYIRHIRTFQNKFLLKNDRYVKANKMELKSFRIMRISRHMSFVLGPLEAYETC